MDIILMVGSICSSIMTIIALASLFLKGPKSWIKKWIEKIDEEQLTQFKAEINEKLNLLLERVQKFEQSEQTRLGHAIMTIYDRCTDRGYITLADRKDLIELHHRYKDYNGNHHVDEYYEILMHMEVR